MKNSLGFLLAMMMSMLPLWSAAATDDLAKGEELAGKVWNASGGPAWSNVKTIDFTFAVEKDGKIIARAQHHWDVAAQTDEVKWKGKDVTVNLADPAQTDEAKTAFARWTNDSYWLLMPLKLRDRGLTVAAEGTKEIDGAKRQVLRLSFGKVGLTPNDQYRLYIDPATDQVTSWDYMPAPGKTSHFTWEDYQKSGGLTLATDHKGDGGLQIRILDLKVTDK